jgi:ABC-type Fe2+-enterobactin transport system substrate-binding protein
MAITKTEIAGGTEHRPALLIATPATLTGAVTAMATICCTCYASTTTRGGLIVENRSFLKKETLLNP